jgi:hypothetical protein
LGLKPKDFVYVVTVIKGGLHLIVKYEVDRLLSYEEAKAEFPKHEIDPAHDLLITRRTTMYSLTEPPLDAEVILALQLLDNTLAL